MKKETVKDIKFIEHEAKLHKLPMDTVQKIINNYISYNFSMINDEEHFPDYAQIQITGAELFLQKGITVIYGQPNCGKSSLASAIAINSAEKCNYIVSYLDYEAKMPHSSKLLFSKSPMASNIIYTKRFTKTGMKELILKGLVQVMIVDSITAMFDLAHAAFLKKISSYVPYVIVIAQMRTDINKNHLVPSLSENAYSMCSSEVYITDKEKITIEGTNVTRVYMTVKKSTKNRNLESTKWSVILNNGTVDKLLTQYDWLKNNGYIRTIGGIKYLKTIKMSGKKIIADEKMIDIKSLSSITDEQRGMIEYTYNTLRTDELQHIL